MSCQACLDHGYVCDGLSCETATQLRADLAREKDRRVEHVQTNQRLNRDLQETEKRLARVTAELDTAERKLACSPAHALDSAADKIDALRKRMAELPCTRCEACRASAEDCMRVMQADYDRLRKAWALRELSNARDGSGDWLDRLCANMPPDVADLIREHAGAEIGECTRCGQRAPLAWLPNGQTCAWGCSNGGESDG